MDKRKQNKLESAGWKIGTAEDFLGIKHEETAFIELKIGLAQAIKKQRSGAG